MINKYGLFKFFLITIFIFSCIHLFGSNSDTTLTNLFKMSIDELIEQEVTIATKSAQKITQSPSVISVITSEEIKAMGFRELEEVLMNMPGIGFTQTRLGTKPFEIRGVSDIRQGGRLLIMLDGTPINSVMNGTAVYYGATYNMDQIDRIEVIRGPGSALYGRNAFSGVVNIITKKATAKNQSEIGTSYGSFNTADIHASYGTKSKLFNFYLASKYYTTDGTSSTFDNGMGGKSVYNMTHDNFYLNGNAEYKNLQLFFSYLHVKDGTSVGPYMTYGNTIADLGNYNIRYTTNLLSKLKFSIKIYGRNENRIQNVEQYTPFTTAIDTNYGVPINLLAPEGIYARPVYNEYIYGGETEFNYKLLKNNNLLIGLQFDQHGVKNASVKSNYDLMTGRPLTYTDRENKTRYYSKDNMPTYKPGWIKDGGHDYKNAALYLQDVHYFLPNLSITLGGRLDYDNEIGFIFNPRLGMVWEPFEWAWVKLLYGKAYRAPTTNEQYKIMGLDMGNEKLKYEEIKTSELSCGIKFNRFYSQISLYYNQLNNLILQQSINDSSLIKSYFNTGKNISYGAEFETKYFVTKSIYTFLNYSYCQSEDTRLLFGVKYKLSHPNVSYNKLNYGLNIQFFKNVSYCLIFNYVGPITKFKDTTKDDGSYISKDKVGDYFLLNSSLRITNIFKGFDLSLYGYNLLNQTYYFQDDINAHQPAQQKINFLIRASYSFN